MVAIDTHKTHNISWVDLAAKDVDESIKWYSGLFGWDTFNDGETDYHIFMMGESPVGGVMQMRPGMEDMPQVWSTYVTVEDADATVAEVKEAGGAVFQEPFEIPGGGRIAVIADPSGAALCLFEGNEENGLKLMDENGAPCWFDCATRDTEAVGAFYGEVFGWTSEFMEEMNYTVFSNEGEWVCGMFALPDEVPAEVPSHWVVDFVVPDADAAAEYATSHGGTVTMPPMDTPFGRACGLMDPWGGVLTVIDRSTATQ
ncbi:MAG: VOC family protein [Acidimicrobiales bacterium]|nr:VOC family protein [Acidimicrobiales bacterium]